MLVLVLPYRIACSSSHETKKILKSIAFTEHSLCSISIAFEFFHLPKFFSLRMANESTNQKKNGDDDDDDIVARRYKMRSPLNTLICCVYDNISMTYGIIAGEVWPIHKH